jgi:hypothetical protein
MVCTVYRLTISDQHHHTQSTTLYRPFFFSFSSAFRMHACTHRFSFPYKSWSLASSFSFALLNCVSRNNSVCIVRTRCSSHLGFIFLFVCFITYRDLVATNSTNSQFVPVHPTIHDYFLFSSAAGVVLICSDTYSCVLRFLCCFPFPHRKLHPFCIEIGETWSWRTSNLFLVLFTSSEQGRAG